MILDHLHIAFSWQARQFVLSLSLFHSKFATTYYPYSNHRDVISGPKRKLPTVMGRANPRSSSRTGRALV